MQYLKDLQRFNTQLKANMYHVIIDRRHGSSTGETSQSW